MTSRRMSAFTGRTRASITVLENTSAIRFIQTGSIHSGRCLKRVYVGIYHKISPKHLDRYVGTFAGKHNMRVTNTIDQMQGMVVGMVGKRIRYEDLIADNGLLSGARG